MRQSTCRICFHILLTGIFLLVAALPVQAMRFSHTVHEEKEIRECVTCHLPGATDIIPKRTVCYDCHDAESIVETVLGPARTHTPLWVKTHGPESEMANAQCTRCHSLSFCIDCHKGGELDAGLKKRTARFNVVPSTHTARFRIVHPLKAIGKNIQQCYTCHSKQSCVDCHESYRNRFPARDLVSHQMSWQELISSDDIPNHDGFVLNQCQDCHPGGALSSSEWSSGHAKEARRSLAGCQSCHPDGAACLTCHSATTGLMVSPHPRNWKRIQGKFRREAPEVCDRCH